MTRTDLLDALEALRRAAGQIEAGLRIPDPTPEALAQAWRRAAGCVRVLHCERRDRVSEEGRWGHE